MRTVVYIFFFLLSTLAFAQNNQGEIIYDQTVSMDFGDRPRSERFKQMMKDMPKEFTFKKQLLFNEKASIFGSWNDPDQEAAEVAAAPEGMRVGCVCAWNVPMKRPF